MKRKKMLWKVLRSLLMIIGIVAVLGIYVITVSDLPSRIYTESQQEFLSYNSLRSISQIAPTLKFELADGMAIGEGEFLAMNLPWHTSRVTAILRARYAQEGGVSVPLYNLEFKGIYGFSYNDTVSATIDLYFPFPANLGTLHEVVFKVDDKEPESAIYTTTGISWRTTMQPGDDLDVEISYRADGANSFTYGLVHNQRTDIDITVDVIGLTGSTIPSWSLPASTTETTENGEQWTWSYAGLIADRDILLELPQHLNFAQRVAAKQNEYRTLGWAAPWLTALFLCAMGVILNAGGIRLRLESYLLMGLGIVLFFPLLTFFSGVLPQFFAGLLAFSLVTGLILLFVSRAVRSAKVLQQTSLLLVVFLGLFSLGLISPWRGLMLTTGAVILVGTIMMLYAHRAVVPDVAPDLPTPPDQEADQVIPDEDQTVDESSIDSPQEVSSIESHSLPHVRPCIVEAHADPEPDRSHCPYCARELAQDYAFCPGCGHDTSGVYRCEGCGHIQFIPAGSNTLYCVQCGSEIRKEETNIISP